MSDETTPQDDKAMSPASAGSGSRKEYAELRLIADAAERNEFVALECGVVHWCPQSPGAISSHQLRWIADELDRRNAVER
jgi:hypothetical protein